MALELAFTNDEFSIDDIEILRGFAVLLVIVEHMQHNLFTWATPTLNRLYTYLGGWTGVDLFFAISGFVIARRRDEPGCRQEHQIQLNAVVLAQAQRLIN